MSQQDFQILKSTLVNALTLVGGGRANADALTAYAALYIAELDAFYRDERPVPTSFAAKASVGAGLKEEARRGVESALLRLATRAFGGAGRTNLTRELEPYEAARRTLGIAKDEARKTLDYLVSLERRGPPPPPVPAQTQTPMRKGSKQRRSPLRDVNANTSPVKKKSKNVKKAAPRSSGVTIQDQNTMAMRMSSTKRVDWTINLPANVKDENEEKLRILDSDVVGKPARKLKVKVEAKENSSVLSSATPATVPARATSVATSALKKKVKVVVKFTSSTSTSVAPARAAAPALIAVAVTAAGSKTNKTRSALTISKTGPSTPT